ncbi:MAG: nucleotidyltransferase family protein, partial [Actinobacteria bacterium]|nr:nucleotidyltransferase family protein [Actinomycetota bacterium]
SLRAALDALADDAAVEAVCVGLADQPRVGAEAYRRLAAAGEEGAILAVATYAGQRANPVLLARGVWPDACALEGDEGARQLMGRHPVVEVDCTGTGDPADVDTLDDLRALDGADPTASPTESP